MTTTLLIRTFSQLPARDIRALRQWVRCGVINRRDDVALLCDYLSENVGKTGARYLSAEALWSAACPGKPFDAKQLRHIMSFLLTAVRQYLAWDEWQSDERDAQPYLLRAMRRRGFDSLFEKSLEDSLEQLEEQPVRDSRYHYNRFLVKQEELDYHAVYENPERFDDRTSPDELTAFYLSEMLRQACFVRMQQTNGDIDFRIDLQNVILKTAGKLEMLQVPAVAVYYHAYRMFESLSEDEPFERLKTVLNSCQNCFTPEEMRELYLMAINGCLRRMQAGRRSYVRETFELYKTALARDFLRENGRLSGATYKNVLKVAAGLNEFAWAEKFLEEYKNDLHAKERDNLYRYGLAYIRFRQQDYRSAMTLLQQIDFEDVLSNLDARRMLLQSYYELREWGALNSFLQGFSTYLRKQKDIGLHRTNNENLIHYTKKLVEAAGDRPALYALQREINSRSDVAEKAWLLERLSQE